MGNDPSSSVLSISGDGRFVAFSSSASNLVPGDTNNEYDVFLHDRLTGIVDRISVDSSGGQADDRSFSPVISTDGRFVAFESWAGNLVSGDTNSTADIFVHDRVSGMTSRVSVDSGGVEGGSSSTRPSISSDGRFVAFDSWASNLVPGDSFNRMDVFVHDRSTGITSIASVDSLGMQGNNDSLSASISGDGRYVAFTSLVRSFDPADNNLAEDIFVKDMLTGQISRVSVDSNGLEANELSRFSSISGDGRFVVFESYATNLVPGDTNSVRDIFLHDRASGQTTRVSVNAWGVEGNHQSSFPEISDDGRFVSFRSDAHNLVPGDSNILRDIFVRDLAAARTTRVSVDSTGAESDGTCQSSALSADGRFVAFSSDATNLVTKAPNDYTDVFVHDRLGPSLTKQGDCGGRVRFITSGGTLGRKVVLLFGVAGFSVKPNPPCQGVALGIYQPRTAAIMTTNTYGIASATWIVPAAACGLTFQAVDVATCLVTNTFLL